MCSELERLVLTSRGSESNAQTRVFHLVNGRCGRVRFRNPYWILPIRGIFSKRGFFGPLFSFIASNWKNLWLVLGKNWGA